MNSSLIKENLIEFFRKLDDKSKNDITEQALKYQTAMNTGDSEAIKNSYSMFLAVVVNLEQQTNIPILKSSDGTYFSSLTALSGIICQAYKRKKAEIKPTRTSISFETIEAADSWLSKNNNIHVTSLNVETESRLGLFANHSEATHIKIGYTDYKQPVGYRYRMCEEESTSLFVKSDKESLKEKWICDNPKFELVCMAVSRNSRGSASSIAFGFGLDRVEHTTLFIVYREKII